MFSIFGALNTTKVATTFGLILKDLGVTNLGSLGYGVSPVSSEVAKGNAASAEAAGLKVGYLNANFPFGSTNVGPVAIDMKNGGVDGFTATTDPNTAFALITALKNQGVDLKAAVLATGFGSDLLQAGPGALQAAQNVYFTTGVRAVLDEHGCHQAVRRGPQDRRVHHEPGDLRSVRRVPLGRPARPGAAGDRRQHEHAAIISSLEKVTDWNGARALRGPEGRHQ